MIPAFFHATAGLPGALPFVAQRRAGDAAQGDAGRFISKNNLFPFYDARMQRILSLGEGWGRIRATFAPYLASRAKKENKA
ncbi:MAG: hypothetical protein ACLVI5_04915 [Desulfovibrio piger]|uniref:hypothetical protein n=1 Tax=Desulfovibrio sp. TaxID=885 RepID=UPI0030798935